MRAALAIGAVLAAPAAAAAVDESRFRFERPVTAPAGGPVLVEPDGPMFAHARREFADLRVVAADGRQVPWRFVPFEVSAREAPVTVLNRGRADGRAVALVDRGPAPGVVNVLSVATSQRGFVGRVEVLGSDRRAGPFTRLSTTAIYDIRGARRARSTDAVFPPADFRYLLVRATGLRAIDTVLVPARPPRERLRPRSAVTRVRTRGRRTVVTLDLRYRDVPVDRVRIDSATKRFDRPVAVAGSNDRRSFVPLGGGRLFRFGAPAQTTIPVTAEHRFLRVTIENGDDPPLAGLRLTALARPRTLVLAGRFPRPYRLLYGNRRIAAPEYDFSQLPRTSLGLGRARVGRLGPERRIHSFGPQESFFARHDWVVEVALGLAAVVVGAVAFLALRRRSGESAA